eukprot:GEMP01031371.1.p1 GENE.GEMP01031371.1~~GEMP01031371.1.p1  ORF type:complete len:221 (-),score=71.31 GEMP01031371.1:1472-2134(-)
MLFASAVLATVASAARELTPTDFDDVVFNSGKATFIKFFAPWCGHCKKMAPTWDDLEKEHKDSELVTIADVDCTADGKPLCEKYGVSGFPTVKYWLAGGEPTKGKDYSGERDLPGLKKFVQKTFKPACIPSTGTGCDDAQKALIEQFKGKDHAAELETITVDLKTKAAERKVIEDEFKTKRREMKKAEKELQKSASVLKLVLKEAEAAATPTEEKTQEEL